MILNRQNFKANIPDTQLFTLLTELVNKIMLFSVQFPGRV